jgi:hypothetical protein
MRVCGLVKPSSRTQFKSFAVDMCTVNVKQRMQTMISDVPLMQGVLGRSSDDVKEPAHIRVYNLATEALPCVGSGSPLFLI